MIAGLAALLWLFPPLVFLHLSPLPMPAQMLNQAWLYYFGFALVAYLLVRHFSPEKRGLVVIGICMIAFMIEVFNVAYFHQGDGEAFRTPFFLADLLGVGLGTTLRRFPDRWDEV
jgi:hypothetical protein